MRVLLLTVAVISVSAATPLQPAAVPPQQPTIVSVALCDATPSAIQDWSITAPNTTTWNTPRFDFSVASKSLQPVGALRWSANGSLGLPDHPLGVFAFEGKGPACGSDQAAYIYDGVLGQMLFQFPPCAQADGHRTVGGSVGAHVDVWTPIPTLPAVSVATGFTLELRLDDDESAARGIPLLCATISLWEPASGPPSKEEDVCQTDMAHPPKYPPDASQNLPSVVVDLDEPAETRWAHVVQPRAAGIQALIDSYIEHLPGSNVNSTLVLLLLDIAAGKEMRRFPDAYHQEIVGIARATGISVGELWVLNIMYEVIGYCTSLIAQDAAGHVWHGRNLDFGLFMGSDPETHSWYLTQKLREIQFNVLFTRGGKPLYNATTYAGFVGLLSGVKANGFSVTVDTRYDSTLDAGLIGWLRGKHSDCHFLTFATRDTMEANASYAEALHTLRTYHPLGPAYIIVGGVASGEGAVITKHFNVTAENAGLPWDPTLDVWDLRDEVEAGSFYVLQTNYDRWRPPPEFDDRRYPAMNCLEAIGTDGLTAAMLWGVLSSNPTRNALTTFSTVMSAAEGHFEAYTQTCAPGPDCAPF